MRAVSVPVDAFPFGRRQRGEVFEVAPVEGLDPPVDPAAAALRELGAQRQRAPRAGPRPAFSAASAASSATHSRAPPPIVP